MQRAIIAGAVIVALILASWAGFAYSARRSEEVVSGLEQEIAGHKASRLRDEEEREKQRAEIEILRQSFATSQALQETNAENHRLTIVRLRERLIAQGAPPIDPIALPPEVPLGLGLADVYEAWRSCEGAFGATVAALDECTGVVEGQDGLIATSASIESDLRAEIEARERLAEELRSVIKKRKRAGIFKTAAAGLVGYGLASLANQ